MKRSLSGMDTFLYPFHRHPRIRPARNHLTPRHHQRPQRRARSGSQSHPHRQGNRQNAQHRRRAAPGSTSLPQILPANYTITVTANGFGDQTKISRTARQPARHHRLHSHRASQHGHGRRLRVGADAEYHRRLARQLRGQCRHPGAAQRNPQRARPAFAAARRALPAEQSRVTAAAAPSTAAVPTRATSPSTAWTTTIRSTDTPLPASCARHRTRSKSSA